jgi:hypothetical protein
MLVASLAALATCFGAAAMEPDCRDVPPPPTVVPVPGAAVRIPNSPCRLTFPVGGPAVCEFGAGTRTVALVGDSHAGHWRAALSIVALAEGWRGVSITHTSCPLQQAVRDLPEPKRTACREWKRQVFAWFAQHPEVDTVFTAGLTGGSGVEPEGGASRFATARRGYARAWAALPATVRTIVVIRDTPKFRGRTIGCVERAVSRHRPPGLACALDRDEALDRDPAIAAARADRSGRVRTVDLTRYFCDAERCFPVVGGVLVVRDHSHMTGAFSATLGPYLRQALTLPG